MLGFPSSTAVDASRSYEIAYAFARLADLFVKRLISLLATYSKTFYVAKA